MSDHKLDKIVADIQQIKVDVAMIKVDVHHHIKRSDLADKRMDYLQGNLSKLEYTLIGVAVIGILGGLAKLLI